MFNFIRSVRNVFLRPRCHRRRHRSAPAQIGAMEAGGLETRVLLAVYNVTTPTDVVNGTDGVLSLREAINLANATSGVPDEIRLSAPSYSVTLGQMRITDSLTIRNYRNGEGPISSAFPVTIDAQYLSRIFEVTQTGGNVTLTGLGLTGGKPTGTEAGTGGGAILSSTPLMLKVDQCTFYDNLTDSITQTPQNPLGTPNVEPGGAIHLTPSVFGAGGTLQIESSSFLNNRTLKGQSHGGAIYAGPGTIVNVNASTIQGNYVSEHATFGGAIMLNNATMTVSDSLIDNNRSIYSASPGGAIYAQASNVQIISSRVTANYTTGGSSQGGAIYVTGGGLLTLDKSRIDQNYTSLNDSAGGAVAAFNGARVKVLSSMLSRNSTKAPLAGLAGDSSGGAIYAAEGVRLTVLNSTLNSNSTNGSNGGGISALGSNDAGNNEGITSVAIVNSTLSGNNTIDSRPGIAMSDLGAGGGVFFRQNARVTVINSTLTRNHAPRGGGIATDIPDVTPPHRRLNLRNSIVAANTAKSSNDAPDIDYRGSLLNPLEVRRSLIGINSGLYVDYVNPTTFVLLTDDRNGPNGNYVGTALVPLDPRLAGLTYNGGPIVGGTAGTFILTHALLHNSDARDHSQNDLAMSLGEDAAIGGTDLNSDSELLTDQRMQNSSGADFPRRIGNLVDMGAIEFNTPPVAGNDTFVTNEDTAVSINVLSNDSDADGQALVITHVDGIPVTAGGTAVNAGNGTVSLSTAGTQLIFSPASQYNGPASFTYSISDGKGGTAVAVVSGTVTPVADPPIVAMTTTPLNYTENQTPINVAFDATITANDGPTLLQVSVQIVSGYVQGGDFLTFTYDSSTMGPNTIYASFVASTGRMNLYHHNGTAIVPVLTQYLQAALRGVKYRSGENPNPNPAPNPGLNQINGPVQRTLAFWANDGASPSAPVTNRTLNVTAVNDAPVVATSNTVAFTGTPIAVNPGFSVTDVDSPNIKQIILEISSATYQTGDLLSIPSGALPSGISASFNPTTRRFTLFAAAGETLLKFRDAVRATTYSVSGGSAIGRREISIWANDGQSVNFNSNTITTVINPTAPSLSSPDSATFTYQTGGTNHVVPNLVVTSATNVRGAAIVIEGYKTGDQLTVSLFAGITGSFDSVNGIMTLSGAATASEFQTVLRSAVFTASASTGLRRLKVRVWNNPDGSLELFSSWIVRSTTI